MKSNYKYFTRHKEEKKFKYFENYMKYTKIKRK